MTTRTDRDDERPPDDSTICLLLAHDANRAVLADWLAAVDRYSVEVAADPTEVDDGVDLCLVDDGAARRGADALDDWKTGVDVFRPCVLVTDGTEGALSPGLREMVDDVVELPTEQAALEGRIDQLLHERERARAFEVERERLQAQNERLRQFAARLSHDLRNPLGIAQGYVGEARESGDEECLRIVEEALERMQRLVDETLMLAKMGETAIDREPVTLREAAETAWSHVDTGDATLSVDGDAGFDADTGRLGALFENLYRNAVEHAGADAAVSVGPLPDGFYVEDDGPGVPEDDREMVFEVGYTTREDGTGFGLRIVQEIAEAHGWTVAATESADGGARFEVTGVELGPA